MSAGSSRKRSPPLRTDEQAAKRPVALSRSHSAPETDAVRLAVEPKRTAADSEMHFAAATSGGTSPAVLLHQNQSLIFRLREAQRQVERLESRLQAGEARRSEARHAFGALMRLWTHLNDEALAALRQLGAADVGTLFPRLQHFESDAPGGCGRASSGDADEAAESWEGAIVAAPLAKRCFIESLADAAARASKRSVDTLLAVDGGNAAGNRRESEGSDDDDDDDDDGEGRAGRGRGDRSWRRRRRSEVRAWREAAHAAWTESPAAGTPSAQLREQVARTCAALHAVATARSAASGTAAGSGAGKETSAGRVAAEVTLRRSQVLDLRAKLNEACEAAEEAQLRRHRAERQLDRCRAELERARDGAPPPLRAGGTHSPKDRSSGTSTAEGAASGAAGGRAGPAQAAAAAPGAGGNGAATGPASGDGAKTGAPAAGGGDGGGGASKEEDEVHAQRLEALERAEDRVAELEKQVAVQQRAIARAEEEAEKSRAEAAARRGPVDPASLSKAQIGSLPLVQDLRRQVAQLESRCATVAMERDLAVAAAEEVDTISQQRLSAVVDSYRQLEASVSDVAREAASERERRAAVEKQLQEVRAAGEVDRADKATAEKERDALKEEVAALRARGGEGESATARALRDALASVETMRKQVREADARVEALRKGGAGAEGETEAELARLRAAVETERERAENADSAFEGVLAEVEDLSTRLEAAEKARQQQRAGEQEAAESQAAAARQRLLLSHKVAAAESRAAAAEERSKRAEALAEAAGKAEREAEGLVQASQERASAAEREVGANKERLEAMEGKVAAAEALRARVEAEREAAEEQEAATDAAVKDMSRRVKEAERAQRERWEQAARLQGRLEKAQARVTALRDQLTGGAGAEPGTGASGAVTLSNGMVLEADLVETIYADKKQLEKCPLCGERRRRCVLSACGHTFCKRCIDTAVKSRNRRCPSCKHAFATTDVLDFYTQGGDA